MENENFRFFMQQVKSLEKDHQGEFAVVHKQQIVNFFDNFDDACAYAEENYEDGTYLVQPCAYELNLVKSRRITGAVSG